MAERPLTERMRGVLVVLANAPDGLTPNQIGYSLGFKDGGKASIPKHRTGGGCIRVMGPAQRVNFSLTALRKRGLVTFTRRADGYSGTAYAITPQGVAALL